MAYHDKAGGGELHRDHVVLVRGILVLHSVGRDQGWHILQLKMKNIYEVVTFGIFGDTESILLKKVVFVLLLQLKWLITLYAMFKRLVICNNSSCIMLCSIDYKMMLMRGNVMLDLIPFFCH